MPDYEPQIKNSKFIWKGQTVNYNLKYKIIMTKIVTIYIIPVSLKKKKKTH